MLESIFGVEKYIDSNNSEIKNNQYVLPIGIGFDKVAPNSAVKGLSQLEKQTLLSRFVTLNDKDFLEIQNKFMSLADPLAYNEPVIEHFEVVISDDAINNNDDQSLKETYLLIPNLKSEERIDYNVGNKKLRIMPSYEEKYLPNFDRYINVTGADFSQGFGFENEKLLTVYDRNYKGTFEKLYSNSLKDIVIGKNCVAGCADLDSDTMMLFSIPFSKGWSAFVDGKNVKIYRADNGLMAIALSKGEHFIKLRYRTPGLFIGMIMTLIGSVSMGIYYKIC